MIETKQYQTWFDEYRQKRYLQHATPDELTRRLDDILVNLVHFDENGVVRVPTIPTPTPFLPLLAHFFEEMRLRNQPQYAFSVTNLNFDDRKYPNARKAMALWKGKNLAPGSYMLKFGKAQFLEPLLGGGSLRLFPASFYGEVSHVAAVRDDELEFNQQLSSGTAKVLDSHGQWRTFTLASPAGLTQAATSNYYLSCYSMLFEPRLFDDFQYDACLVIKDIDRFCGCLREAVVRSLPGWICWIGPVQYRDPYVPMKDPNVYFTKSLRYAYQREFRMLWTPPEDKMNLNPIDVQMEELSEYCDLVRI